LATGSVAASTLCGIALIVQSSLNQRVAIVLGNSLGATLLSIIVAMALALIVSISSLIKRGVKVQPND